MEDLNIMDIASQELTDEQIDNISVLAGAKQSYSSPSVYSVRRRRPVVRDHEKIGRNSPCPCGSGKKYKNCCLKTGEYETTHNK